MKSSGSLGWWLDATNTHRLSDMCSLGEFAQEIGRARNRVCSWRDRRDGLRKGDDKTGRRQPTNFPLPLTKVGNVEIYSRVALGAWYIHWALEHPHEMYDTPEEAKRHLGVRTTARRKMS